MLNIKDDEHYCLNCIIEENRLTSMMDDEVIKAKCPECREDGYDRKGDSLKKTLTKLKVYLNSVCIPDPKPAPTNCTHCDILTAYLIAINVNGTQHHLCRKCQKDGMKEVIGYFVDTFMFKPVKG